MYLLTFAFSAWVNERLQYQEDTSSPVSSALKQSHRDLSAAHDVELSAMMCNKEDDLDLTDTNKRHASGINAVRSSHDAVTMELNDGVANDKVSGLPVGLDTISRSDSDLSCIIRIYDNIDTEESSFRLNDVIDVVEKKKKANKYF